MIDLEKKKELDEIRAKVLACSDCKLCKSRIQAVPGEGNIETEVMFVGEAPGANEDKKGIPFCGAAGKFLDSMLAGIDLKREDIFITNTVKCRPPENRDPEDDEKLACRHYLEEQISQIKPQMIVCLGRHATTSMLPGLESISKLHGKALRQQNGIVYLPLYHPAAALHNGGLRSTLLEDFNKIPVILKKIKENKEI
jgi:DNA polymerase